MFFAPPTLRLKPKSNGALPDVLLNYNTGNQLVTVSGDFQNIGGGQWSVTPAWVINNNDGTISIPTSTLRSSVSVVITYQNLSGSTSSGFSLTVSDATTNIVGGTRSIIVNGLASLAPVTVNGTAQSIEVS
jgi:hypothetical protein